MAGNNVIDTDVTKTGGGPRSAGREMCLACWKSPCECDTVDALKLAAINSQLEGKLTDAEARLARLQAETTAYARETAAAVKTVEKLREQLAKVQDQAIADRQQAVEQLAKLDRSRLDAEHKTVLVEQTLQQATEQAAAAAKTQAAEAHRMLTQHRQDAQQVLAQAKAEAVARQAEAAERIDKFVAKVEGLEKRTAAAEQQLTTERAQARQQLAVAEARIQQAQAAQQLAERKATELQQAQAAVKSSRDALDWIFYVACLGIAVLGQVLVFTKGMDVPVVIAVVAALALELAGITFARKAEARRAVGEYAIVASTLSYLVAITAVGINIVGHTMIGDPFEAAVFGLFSALAFLAWVMDAEFKKRVKDRLSGKADVIAPRYGIRRWAYGAWWTETYKRTRLAKELAIANPSLNELQKSLAAADKQRAEAAAAKREEQRLATLESMIYAINLKELGGDKVLATIETNRTPRQDVAALLGQSANSQSVADKMAALVEETRQEQAAKDRVRNGGSSAKPTKQTAKPRSGRTATATAKPRPAAARDEGPRSDSVATGTAKTTGNQRPQTATTGANQAANAAPSTANTAGDGGDKAASRGKAWELWLSETANGNVPSGADLSRHSGAADSTGRLYCRQFAVVSANRIAGGVMHVSTDVADQIARKAEQVADSERQQILETVEPTLVGLIPV